MIQFSTPREKRLWIWSLLISITIFLSLFLGKPLQHQLRDQNVQAIIFVLGMLFVGITILIHGLRSKPGRFQFTILIGVMAVYVMFFLRLGAPERSHLIEYSILAIFIHSALQERTKVQGVQKLKQALGAFLITFSIGVIDESIQLFLPNRVFDPQDILFNGIVTFFAIGTSLLLNWIRERVKSKEK
ncbi:VanZ family protein [Ekhidna sp.]|uniref:VanZ family protein n=1 Tax=Ekhidna sp. TaxID=2608089 RepID=UPI003297700E